MKISEEFILRKFFVTILSLLILSVVPAVSATVDNVKKAIITQSLAMGVEPAIMLSIAKMESGFRQEARGTSGNVGVFQLYPATAKSMGYNAYNLEENIKAGITYYKNMYKRFDSMEMAVAAYNCGPDAVKRAKGVPTHSRGFVNRIMLDYKYFKAQK